MQVNSLPEAGSYVERILRGRGYDIKKIIPLNQNRHVLLVTEKEGIRSAFYVLYKRAWFYTYGKQFDDVGFGESINIEWFKCIEKSDTVEKILFVYKDGSIYYITPREWGDFVQSQNTVRWTRDGECTTSIRIDLLQRFDRDWTNQEITAWLKKPGLSESFKKCLMNLYHRIERGIKSAMPKM